MGRLEGLALVTAYVAYVAAIWHAERRPPALGETGELDEAAEQATAGGRRISRELALGSPD